MVWGGGGGLYKGIKWELWSCLWACLGVFVGVVWYYMGLFLYKSGGKYGKMGVFCGFLVVFCVGVGESWEGWEVLEYVKGFILWGYESININFLNGKNKIIIVIIF